MTTLICGSLAYDTIMVFKDRFKNHILPDKIHMLSVGFVVPELRQEFGGTAGNVAFNLNLLQGDGLILATAGKDFNEYAMWMDQQGLSRALIRVLDDEFTARAYVTTDLDDNQITAFHPGAMGRAHENENAWPDDVNLGMISPNGRDAILNHAKAFQAAKIPFLFDPGQAITLFTGEELRLLVEQCTYLSCNDYESSLLMDKTDLDLEAIAGQVEMFTVTKGAQGAVIYASGETHDIPTAEVSQVVDPTGCGDAFRAGLLYGIDRGLDWPTTGRIASLMGAYKIEHHGTQNHRFTLNDFETRFTKNFGQPLALAA